MHTTQLRTDEEHKLPDLLPRGILDTEWLIHKPDSLMLSKGSFHLPESRLKREAFLFNLFACFLDVLMKHKLTAEENG